MPDITAADLYMAAFCLSLISGAVLVCAVSAKLAATRRPVWVAALMASVFFSCTFSYLIFKLYVGIEDEGSWVGYAIASVAMSVVIVLSRMLCLERTSRQGGKSC
jgi:heme/copper-type cytochrome/quinol oxidase subunit 4